jgi:polysaccharide deacetylase family protein (PEP-CTERM system associated)
VSATAAVVVDRPVVNAMSVDVEDYFQVSAFDGVVPRSAWETRESRVVRYTERLLAIFDQHAVRGTFFVLGWVAERFPALLRTIAAAGHEIASHGYGHGLVYDQSREAFREDIRRSKAVIEGACGVHVRGYRAPSFSITRRSLWALDVLIDEGFEYDASIFPIHHDRYGIAASPRFPYRVERDAGSLIELPGSTVALGALNLPVGGGGYFRLLPYAWTRHGIARLNRQDRQPAVFYIHPWEVDPAQPRISVGWLTRFRHYRNLDRTEARLHRLLRAFTFAPVRDVLMAAAPALSAFDLAEAPRLPASRAAEARL